jgi:hypothetical protein
MGVAKLFLGVANVIIRKRLMHVWLVVMWIGVSMIYLGPTIGDLAGADTGAQELGTKTQRGLEEKHGSSDVESRSRDRGRRDDD